MRSQGKNDSPAVRKLLLICMVMSAVFGIVIGEAFSYGSHGDLHLVSITGRGPLADGLAVLLVILILFGTLGKSTALRPIWRVILGAVLAVVPFVAPAILTRIAPGTKIDLQAGSAFLFLSIVEVLGACFLASGLLRQLSLKKERAHYSRDRERE